jgi:hypothetical protein
VGVGVAPAVAVTVGVAVAVEELVATTGAEVVGAGVVETDGVGDGVVGAGVGDGVVETDGVGDGVVETDGVGDGVVETDGVGDTDVVGDGAMLTTATDMAAVEYPPVMGAAAGATTVPPPAPPQLFAVGLGVLGLCAAASRAVTAELSASWATVTCCWALASSICARTWPDCTWSPGRTLTTVTVPDVLKLRLRSCAGRNEPVVATASETSPRSTLLVAVSRTAFGASPVRAFAAAEADSTTTKVTPAAIHRARRLRTIQLSAFRPIPMGASVVAPARSSLGQTWEFRQSQQKAAIPSRLRVSSDLTWR